MPRMPDITLTADGPGPPRSQKPILTNADPETNVLGGSGGGKTPPTCRPAKQGNIAPGAAS